MRRVPFLIPHRPEADQDHAHSGARRGVEPPSAGRPRLPPSPLSTASAPAAPPRAFVRRRARSRGPPKRKNIHTPPSTRLGRGLGHQVNRICFVMVICCIQRSHHSHHSLTRRHLQLPKVNTAQESAAPKHEAGDLVVVHGPAGAAIQETLRAAHLALLRRDVEGREAPAICHVSVRAQLQQHKHLRRQGGRQHMAHGKVGCRVGRDVVSTGDSETVV